MSLPLIWPEVHYYNGGNDDANKLFPDYLWGAGTEPTLLHTTSCFFNNLYLLFIIITLRKSLRWDECWKAVKGAVATVDQYRRTLNSVSKNPWPIPLPKLLYSSQLQPVYDLLSWSWHCSPQQCYKGFTSLIHEQQNTAFILRQMLGTLPK